MKKLLIFSQLFLLIHSFELISPSLICENEGILIKFIVEVINDWNEKHLSVFEKDIAIVDLEDNRSFLHELLKEIPDENSILLMRGSNEKRHMYENTRKAEIILMISKYIDVENLIKNIYQYLDEPFWSPNSNLIFISLNENLQEVTELTSIGGLLSQAKCIKTIILNINLQILMRIDVLKHSFELMLLTNNTDALFIDRLIDMKDFSYKVAVNKHSNRFKNVNGTLAGNDLFLLDLVASKQNASVERIIFEKFTREQLLNMLNQGSVDFISFAFGVELELRHHTTIIAYNENGYCALISRPSKYGIIFQLFKPFDAYTWIFLFLSVFCATVTWKLLRRSNIGNSTFYFFYGIFSAFLLQAIPFRRNRFMQVLIHQIFVFTLLILGSLYQGEIISTILSHDNDGKLITTPEELLNNQNNFIFYSDAKFKMLIGNYENYLEFSDQKLRVLDIFIETDEYLKQFIEVLEHNKDHLVIIILCNSVERLFNSKLNFGYVRDHFYRMPHKFYSFYEEMVATRRSPFLGRFNEYSLRIFESGIHQYWDIMLSNTNRLPQDEEIEVNSITMKEFKYVAEYVLTFGFSLSLSAFIFEVFWWKYGGKIGNALNILSRRILRSF